VASGRPSKLALRKGSSGRLEEAGWSRLISERVACKWGPLEERWRSNYRGQARIWTGLSSAHRHCTVAPNRRGAFPADALGCGAVASASGAARAVPSCSEKDELANCGARQLENWPAHSPALQTAGRPASQPAGRPERVGLGGGQKSKDKGGPFGIGWRDLRARYVHGWGIFLGLAGCSRPRLTSPS